MPREVCGFYINKQFAIASDGTKPSSNKPHDICVWLVQHSQNINIIYNMNHSMACLLRRMNLKKEQLATLQSQNKLWHSNVQITFISDKYCAFRVGADYNAPYASFSDASQYMTTELQDEVSEDYCFKKACEAKECGDKVANAMRILKFEPDALISPINQFSKHLMPRMRKKIPLVDDLPHEEIGEFAYNCCRGGWFENYTKLHAQSVVDLDINSSYPFVLANLPDYRYGTWTHVKEKSNAPIGFYKGTWTITSHFSPIMYKVKTKDNGYDTEKQVDNPNVCPVGTWESYATLQEIDFVEKWKLGHFEVQEGWEWDKPSQFIQPWKKIIERLYELKQSHTGLERDVLKRTLNGQFGKCLEVRKDNAGNITFGDYFSPVLGSYIETSARLRVAEVCMVNNMIPISIAVDGLTFLEMPEILDVGDGLGQWKITHKDEPCISINAEICSIKNKNSGLPFAITYEWLKDEIEKNPEKHIYTMTQRSFVSLGKAIQSNEIDCLGDIRDMPRSLDLCDDTKRLFKDMPQTGRELISGKHFESIPLPVEMIELANLPKVDDEDLTGLG
jgi:hypothetical protein